MRPEANGSLNSVDVARGESPAAMQLRLAAQLEALAGSGIQVDSLRKVTGTKALGVNPAEVTNKTEKGSEV